MVDGQCEERQAASVPRIANGATIHTAGASPIPKNVNWLGARTQPTGPPVPANVSVRNVVEEAPLAGPLHDPERERGRRAASCSEPPDPAPVALDSEPAEHSESRPDPRQFAGMRRAPRALPARSSNQIVSRCTALVTASRASRSGALPAAHLPRQ